MSDREMKVSATGVPWYRREQYEEIRALFVDGANLPRTFDDWLAKAEHVEAQLKAAGQRVIRAEIQPVPFREWCEAERLPLNSASRGRFAAMKARDHVRNEGR